LKRFDDALASFDRATALRPDFAEAYSNRGVALKDMGRFEEAMASCDKAIALSPDHPEAHNNRGVVLVDMMQFENALVEYDTAIALKPTFAEAHSNRAVALRGVKRFAEAVASCDTAIALSPEYTEAHYNMGTLLLALGDLERGWQEYDWRRKSGSSHGDDRYPQPVWLGKEPIAGKTLFVRWEQGLGDTLQFCRYARIVHALGAKVILSVQDPLLPLLKQLEPEVEIIGADEVPAAFDYHCALMSLPLALGTTLGTIPATPWYLRADETQRWRWAARLGPKTVPRIGLAWSGNKDYADDRNRSIDLAAFSRVLSDGAAWISLQKEIRETDVPLLRDPPGIAFHGDALADFADTAALVDLMDLVITVDTSIAHLAGAMGKSVWIMLPFNADWRWLIDRSDTPWYPSARLFRQPAPGDWRPVLGAVKDALRIVLAPATAG
jgi:tetratricopeptide (TPR) repeat protein